MFTPRALRAASAVLALALAPGLAARADDERQSLEELRNTVVNLLQALVDQGVISKEKAQQMVRAAQDKAAADAAASLAQSGVTPKEDQGAVRVPYVPQIVQDQIAKQVADQVRPAVVADVVKEAKTEKWGVPGALADWLTRTRLYGDVTLREEGIFYSALNAPEFNYFGINSAGGISQAGANAFLDTDENRIRFRARARLGLEPPSVIRLPPACGSRPAIPRISSLKPRQRTERLRMHSASTNCTSGWMNAMRNDFRG